MNYMNDVKSGDILVLVGTRKGVFILRSSNRGTDWEAMTKGLPQRNAYLHALRDGMATDALDPCGVYIGTTTDRSSTVETTAIHGNS